MANKKNGFSDYVRSFYNSLDKKSYKTYSDWKWFRSKSSKAQYIQTKNTIIKVLNGKRFSSAFEIGPGDGIWTKLLLNYSKQIDALDLSEEMLDMATKRLNGAKVGLRHGDFLTTKIKKKYDLIYSIRCIEYLPDKDRAINKISSIANKGAGVLLVTKNPHFMKLIKQDKKLHSNQIEVLALKGLLEKYGLQVVFIHPAVFGKGFHIPMIRPFLSIMHDRILRKTVFKNNFFIKHFSESFLIFAQKK